MGWIMLLTAGLLEIVWATALKYSDGFSNTVPTIIFLVSTALSLACLSFALKTIPMGNAYAIWGGIGAVGITIVGIIWFKEPVSFIRIFCILLIVLGILGLKFLTTD